MIVKILSSASSEFNGVRYNNRKINSEKGELMSMKNFPSFINSESSQQEVRDYLKSVSQNKKVQKPQFHAVISTKFQEHNKEQLTEIAEDFMKEMGYEKQPYIVVFHNDTENNHVHIVSTRVDKYTGKKINDSFEKLKSQRALNAVLEKHLGISNQSELDDLLAYKFSNFQQLEKLLNRNGFKVIIDDNSNQATILKNGVAHKTLFLDKIEYTTDYQKDKRSKQLKAFLEKYKEIYSNKVFKVIDNREQEGMYQREANAEVKDIPPKIEFESELQHKLREIFGIDIMFHFKDDKKPFGYTLIDNATQKVYKGSDILKMKDLFEFVDDSIEKKEFEQIKAYNLKSDLEKKILTEFFQRKGVAIKDFMLFENKRFKKDIKVYKQLKEEINDLVKNPRCNDFVSFIKDENGDYYVVHQRHHQIHKLENLIRSETYEQFMHPEKNVQQEKASQGEGSLIADMDELFATLAKSTYVSKDTTEEDLKRKRKKRR